MKKVSRSLKEAKSILLHLFIVLSFISSRTLGMEEEPYNSSSQITIHNKSATDSEKEEPSFKALDSSDKYKEYDEEGNFVRKAHSTWNDYTYWWNYAPRDNVDYACHYVRFSVDIWTRYNGITIPYDDLIKALNYARQAQDYATKANIFPHLQNINIDINAINAVKTTLEKEVWNSRFFGLGYYIPLKNTVVAGARKPKIPFMKTKRVLVAGNYHYRPLYKGSLGIDDRDISAVIGVSFFKTKGYMTNTTFDFWELGEHERFVPLFPLYARHGSPMLFFFNCSSVDSYSLYIFENYYNTIDKYKRITQNITKIILLGIGNGLIGDLSKIEKFKSKSNLFICVSSAKETYQKNYVTNMVYAYVLEDEQRIKATQKQYLIEKPKTEEYIFFNRNNEEAPLQTGEINL
ncbi:MAG: hypothetical protein H0X26_09520 [Alphaproteobacteria bacterium]|nr:hypothetical protein [Alphaproteobacteria bacterium]